MMDKSYEGDELEDRIEFAREITGLIKEQLATQRLEGKTDGKTGKGVKPIN